VTFETDMCGFLERGETCDLSSFGGLDAVLRGSAEIASSTVAEFFIDLVLPYHVERAVDVGSFIADIVESLESDIGISAVADRIARRPISDERSLSRIFKRFSTLFADRLHSVSLRIAALKGAYLAAVGHPGRTARLASRIIEIEDEPLTAILASAARVAGLILSVSDNDGLVYFLREFQDSGPGDDQIKLELGLLELKKALTASERDRAFACLGTARDYFHASCVLRSTRHEARAYGLAIDVLLVFAEGGGAAAVEEPISELRKAAWAYDAYVTQGMADPLLGAVAAQKAAFTTLALRLSNLSTSMSERTWLYAASVIEEQLLVAYTANSFVLGGDRAMGVDLLVRPPIEKSLLGNHMFAAAMEQWLETNAAELDVGLTADIRAFMEHQTRNPRTRIPRT
jgi:hypothetical protein